MSYFLRKIKYLYHGTNKWFEMIDLKKSRRAKDFGPGFYLTTNRNQAIEWAKNKAGFKNETFVMRYPFCYIDGMDELELVEYDEKWLKFIADNRDGNSSEASKYDIIYDKMADGRKNTGMLDEVLTRYRYNKISSDEAIAKLKYDVSYDQYCIKTERALKMISQEERSVYRYYRENNVWKYEKLI